MTSDKKIEDEVQADASAGVTNSTVPTASDVTSEPSPSMPAPDNGEITRLKAEAADLKDRLLRAHAEMDNVRKRLEREKTDTAKFAITKFAKDVVGIGDNVQRAIDAVPHRQVEQDAALKSFVEGVTMIERELLAVLGRHGITKLDPKGEPFNPHHHQAVVEVPSAEVPAGSVTQVFQAGYMIEERVLRPAMVAVSKGGAKVPSPAEETPCDAGTPPVADDSAPGGASGSA